MKITRMHRILRIQCIPCITFYFDGRHTGRKMAELRTVVDSMSQPKEPAVPSYEPSRLYAYLAISALLSLTTWILLMLPNFLGERGWSSQAIGWAIGSYFLVNLVCQILSGQIADRYGNVPTALCGAALAGTGGFLYLATLWVTWIIFPARILHAAGAAMIFAGALMHLLKSVPIHLKGRMMGYYGLPGFVMMGVGPLFSEWFAYRWGFRGIFLAIPLIFAALAWILSRLPRPLEPRGTRRQPFSEALRASVPSLRPVLFFSVIFGLCFSAWNSFLAPAVRSVGTGAVSSFGLGYGLGAVTTRLGLSHHLDTGPRRLVAISTLLVYSASLALIPQAFAIWQLVALGLICGMVHGTYYPSLSSLAAEQFHPLHEGQAMSLYVSASALGMFLGPPLWGALADSAGYPIMFAAAGSILAINTSTFVVSERREMARRRLSRSSTRQTAYKISKSLK